MREREGREGGRERGREGEREGGEREGLLHYSWREGVLT